MPAQKDVKAAALAARTRRLLARYKEHAKVYGERREIITIRTADKTREVAALRCGPFAIHKEYRQTVTHVASGTALASGFDTIAEAKCAVAVALDVAIDWANESPLELLTLAEVDVLSARVREINNGTVSQADIDAYLAERAAETVERPARPSDEDCRESKRNPASARHGLTKPQAAYLAAELRYALLTGHFDRGEGYAYEIAVPCGPTYRVTTAQAANTLHKTLTGSLGSDEHKTLEETLCKFGRMGLYPSPRDYTPATPPAKVDPMALAARYQHAYDADDCQGLAESFRALAKGALA